MPSRPPGLKAKSKTGGGNWNRTGKTAERGYGWPHQKMRRRVLREEPLCRICLAMTPQRYSPSVIADHIVPKFEGGSDDRENYQGICAECDKVKTAAEAKRAQVRCRS